MEVKIVMGYNLKMAEKNKSLKFIDLFAGIGGIKIAFEQAGYECVFSNDFDANCRTTFDLNFNERMVLEDIKKIPTDNIPEFDVLTGGFPCQAFSVAGYRQGFNDEKGRGNLFFEIVRILEAKRPKAFLLENVKNLKGHDKGNTIKVIYDELSRLGYKVTDKVLNAFEYGNLPQNRERIYIVGFLEQGAFNRFKFPSRIPLQKTMRECLEKNVDSKYYYEGKPLYERIKNDVIKKNTVYQWRRKYVRENKRGICPTLTANMGMGGHNVPIILDDKGIRKLTPRECANLQGFPADYKLPEIAESHLYKQFGNSVPIPVITRIAKRIKIALGY
jgi:DNA (cytosine-5)-methyltransferase 1